MTIEISLNPNEPEALLANLYVNEGQQLAEAGFSCPAMVHPTAFVEASALLSAGV